MRYLRNKRNSQHGGSLIEAIIAVAILTISASFVASGFMSNLQARESFRVSRSAKKVENAIQNQVAFYFQQTFDNRNGRDGNPLGPPTIPLCNQLPRINILNADLEDGVSLIAYNEQDLKNLISSNTFPNAWTAAFTRCLNQISLPGRTKQCALYRTPNRRGRLVIRGFVEIDARKVNLTNFNPLPNCGIYQGTSTRGFRLAYNIFSYANRKGETRFYNTGGSKWTAGVYYPPEDSGIAPPTEAGPLFPKDEVEDCPPIANTPADIGIGPCYNYEEEEIVICNAVRTSCRRADEARADLAAAQAQVPPNQGLINQLQNALNDLPAANQCTSWRDWCNRDGDLASIPVDLQGPDGFAVEFACRTLVDNDPKICPVPLINGGG